MESLLGPLLPLFERERAAGRAMALGVLLETQGSTYRKPGALILIAGNRDYAGLLSGGCLEGDLGQHAREVIDSQRARLIQYDMRGGEDLIWGLGLGCEGALRILLLRVGPESGWQPLAHLAQSLREHRATAVAIVTESQDAGSPPGTVVLPDSARDDPDCGAWLSEIARTGKSGWREATSPDRKLFALPLALPPRLLLLGAGPDAAPVVDFAVRLNWRVTLADHRPAYADASHFPAAARVVLARPEELWSALDPSGFEAAVVMSHHLPSDLGYLRALARTATNYIGLLGPAVRRERLLADLGPDAERIRPRLHSPVGLRIGGRSPESIALAIVSEIHAFVHGLDTRASGAPQMKTREVAV